MQRVGKGVLVLGEIHSSFGKLCTCAGFAHGTCTLDFAGICMTGFFSKTSMTPMNSQISKRGEQRKPARLSSIYNKSKFSYDAISPHYFDGRDI